MTEPASSSTESSPPLSPAIPETPIHETGEPPRIELSEEAEAQIARTGPRELAIGIMTYNNADTIKMIAERAVLGLERHLPGVTAVIVNADAGSTDGTAEILAASEVPTVRIRHESALSERLKVPFHGVPGRGAALRATLGAAHLLSARALVMLEADVVSMTDEWVPRLAHPVLDEKADLVIPAYARQQYDGTITNLLLSPLMRALYARRVRQPLGGQQALSARLVEHLLIHPRWDWRGRDITDLWMLGTAVADGFAVCESWLGRHQIRSRTRTSDLPTMVAQTLGSLFALMHRHADLWLEVRGSEPLPAVGDPIRPTPGAATVDFARMIDALRLGLRDLMPIWEHILAPETLGEVLALDVSEGGHLRFPNDLWARVVYDFALGYHYGVVHRDHLLRSLVPLYLGCTAAFVLATQGKGIAASEDLLEDVGAAFERQKSYLVERWS